MFEYKGYQVEQTDHGIYMYQNGRFKLHASTTGRMSEEELYQSLDFFIANCINHDMNKCN